MYESNDTVSDQRISEASNDSLAAPSYSPSAHHTPLRAQHSIESGMEKLVIMRPSEPPPQRRQAPPPSLEPTQASSRSQTFASTSSATRLSPLLPVSPPVTSYAEVVLQKDEQSAPTIPWPVYAVDKTKSDSMRSTRTPKTSQVYDTVILGS